MGSPKGKAFTSESGEFWRAAQVASGVDPASAKERSDGRSHSIAARENGCARVRAQAQRRLYSVDAAGLQAVDAWLGQFRSFWEPTLDVLGTEIARGKKERRRAGPATRTGKRA